MVPLISLWAPILIASVIVFVAAFLVWMVLPHHRNDFRPFTADADLDAVLSREKVTPGFYRFPNVDYMKATAEEKERASRMTTGIITIQKPGMTMAGPLVNYFIWLVVVNVFIAYAAGVSLAAGTHYLTVFRVVGTIAILAYTAANIPNSIWFGRPWSVMIKDLIDGAVFGLLTAGVYGWLWPR